jgi:hypothetical protein
MYIYTICYTYQTASFLVDITIADMRLVQLTTTNYY